MVDISASLNAQRPSVDTLFKLSDVFMCGKSTTSPWILFVNAVKWFNTRSKPVVVFLQRAQ